MADGSFIYRPLPVLSAEEIAEAMKSGNEGQISAALLSSANYSATAVEAAKLCRGYLDSPSPELRRIAVMGLGHIALRHFATYHSGADFEAVLEKLKDDNAEVRGAAENALSDMKTHRFANCAYSREKMEDKLNSESLLDTCAAVFVTARNDKDPLYVFKISMHFLHHPHFLLRVAAVWAAYNAWDDLPSSMKAKAREMVSSLLNDNDRWVREDAIRVLESMT